MQANTLLQADEGERSADAALYYAKRNGRNNNVRCYETLLAAADVTFKP